MTPYITAAAPKLLRNSAQIPKKKKEKKERKKEEIASGSKGVRCNPRKRHVKHINNMVLSSRCEQAEIHLCK